MHLFSTVLGSLAGVPALSFGLKPFSQVRPPWSKCHLISQFLLVVSRVGPDFVRSEAFTSESLVRNECAVSNAKLHGSLECEGFPSRSIHLIVKLPGHFCPETLPWRPYLAQCLSRDKTHQRCV